LRPSSRHTAAGLPLKAESVKASICSRRIPTILCAAVHGMCAEQFRAQGSGIASDLEDDALTAAGLSTRDAGANAADPLHRSPRARVLRAHEENDRLDEPEGVPQHQLLHLSVVHAAP